MWSRTEIQKRLAQHARGIDRADEALLREAYHADGTVDYGSLQGTAGEFASAIAAMHDGAPMSSHRTSNMWVRVRGELAVSESYVMAWVTLPTDGEPQPHLVGGRYLDRHSFQNNEWRMQHRHYVLDWIRQFPPASTPSEATPFDWLLRRRAARTTLRMRAMPFCSLTRAKSEKQRRIQP